jgi:hypothetical protein
MPCIEIYGVRLQMPSSNDVKSVKSTGVLTMRRKQSCMVTNNQLDTVCSRDTIMYGTSKFVAFNQKAQANIIGQDELREGVIPSTPLLFTSKASESIGRRSPYSS